MKKNKASTKTKTTKKVVRKSTTPKTKMGKPSLDQNVVTSGPTSPEVLEDKLSAKPKLHDPDFVRYHYIRTSNSIVGCLAYRTQRKDRNEETGEAGSQTIRYGISAHNPKDAFDRQTGRKVALGRLNASDKKDFLSFTDTACGRIYALAAAALGRGVDSHEVNLVVHNGRPHIVSGLYQTLSMDIRVAVAELLEALSHHPMVAGSIRKTLAAKRPELLGRIQGVPVSTPALAL